MLLSNLVMSQDLALIDESIPPEALTGATIVVTGCAGFLGFYFMQYLARYAKRRGIERVIGLDTFLLGQPKWLSELSNNFSDVVEIHDFDVARGDLMTIPAAHGAHYVIHMASIASPTFYRRYPIETIDANIWGLRKLLDCYRDSVQLKGLLFFSSSEIYGDPHATQIPTNEDYRGNVTCVGPRACYDESKRFGETLCYVFAKTYDMPVTIARPFNNYGPGMRMDDRRLPADFAKCILEGRDIVILSDGLPTRTFCYVADALVGYFKCLFYGKFDSFNIGIERPEIEVREFAELFRLAGESIFGYRGSILYEKSTDMQYLTDNPNRRCPVIDKARDKLGYDPQILVKEGVQRYLGFLKQESH